MKFRNFAFIFLLTSWAANAQLPQRKAYMGIFVTQAKEGLLIDSVAQNSTGHSLKLMKSDVLTAINSLPVRTREEYIRAVTNVRSGETISLTVLRKGKAKQVKGSTVAKPLETSSIADLTYDWVKFRDGYLRTITWKPKNKTNVPAILLIPGYGCGSIENYSISYNGKLMSEWIKNGYAVVTIEKSGVGDSYGCKPCVEVDLATDIESFDAGYKYMEQLPFVDKTKLFIWGHSMGGTIAPEVAKLHSPKGVIVFGSVFRPWSEFLLEMHRVQKPLLATMNYEDTETFVRQIQKIYYEFFILKKSPQQLHAVNEYKPLVESELEYKDGSTNMWGRHWRFWQQLDSVNLAKSWRQVKCPVLVLHGGTDYEQCSQLEPLLTVETVNDAHPGNAQSIIIPDLDHFMMKSNSWKEAAQNFKEQQYMKGNFNNKIAEETVKWLKRVSN